MKLWKLILPFLLFLIIALIIIVNLPLYPLKHQNLISDTAKAYGVESSLIAAVIYAESCFEEKAVSEKGALGLMQIMPQTAKWLCEQLSIDFDEKKLLEKEYNLNLGIYYLSYLIEKFRDTKTALCAYNAGEGNVQKWLFQTKYSQNQTILEYTPFHETNKYCKNVLKAQKYYKKFFD